MAAMTTQTVWAVIDKTEIDGGVGIAVVVVLLVAVAGLAKSDNSTLPSMGTLAGWLQVLAGGVLWALALIGESWLLGAGGLFAAGTGMGTLDRNQT